MPIVSGKYTNKADSLRVHDWNSLFWINSTKIYVINVLNIRKLEWDHILCLQNIHNVI